MLRHLLFSLFFLPLTLLSASAAGFEVPGFELVVTTPVETQLANPDLRQPTEVWCEMIASAKESLDFEEMYANSKEGEPLEQVLEALEAAGKRGVKIRFLLETKMLRATEPATVERLKKIPGLELRMIEFGRLNGDSIVHAKYFVVDGQQAYVGSQNFDWRSLKHIHETGLRVSEPKVVAQMSAIFALDWRAAALLEKGEAVPPLRSEGVLPNPEDRAYLVASPLPYLPEGVVDSEAELVRLVGKAKEEVRIQLLDYSASYRDKSYYAPIDTALRAAAARKVKVKLMVSHWNQDKPGIDYLKSLAMLPGIEVKIVTIPRAKEGAIAYGRVIHSKFMEIDGHTSWVGTSNWSGGYLDRLRNLEVVVKDDRLAKRLTDLHEQLWASPYAAFIEPLKDYPAPDKGTK